MPTPGCEVGAEWPGSWAPTPQSEILVRARAPHSEVRKTSPEEPRRPEDGEEECRLSLQPVDDCYTLHGADRPAQYARPLPATVELVQLSGSERAGSIAGRTSRAHSACFQAGIGVCSAVCGTNRERSTS